jgi:NADP-dependent 3-hydroxy acid dehydrogenase YdfG
VYGSTKYGLRYFNRTLVQETKDRPVLIGLLSPGMVVTDLLTEQYQDRPQEWARAKRIFNILADRVETVAPWLTKKMVANTKSGVKITWLTRRKIVGRFLMAGFRKRDLFES